MDVYDIHGIIREALHGGVDISPSDRMEWKMFCCALKVLGYDEATFVALSSGKERDSRQAWRAERSPQRYKTEEDAKGMIVALAKQAGMDVKRFLLSRTNDKRTTSQRPQRPAPPRPQPHHTATPPEPTCAPVYISEQQVNAAAGHFRETSLYTYLCRWFDRAKVEQVFTAYRVGASKYVNTEQGGRAACFPYIAADGRCVDCKIFHIDPSTGSRKTAPPLRSWQNQDGTAGHLPTTWALAEMKMNDRRAPWCNFGDHLLADRPADMVCVVESEKSCLILSLAYPERLWIAVGSMQNLTPERFTQYRGRKITIFPDRDGIPAWSDKAKVLAAEGYNIHLDTTTARHPGEPKDDLADIVLRALQGTQEQPTPPEPRHTTTPPPIPPRQLEAIKVWEDMKQRYPHLQEFEDRFGLEPISVEPWQPAAPCNQLTTKDNNDER